jgi:uncharacterized protein YbjQ (UPF0145 family)
MAKKIKRFFITRVATKDIITDSFQGLRNFFGLRLRGYEAMLNKYIQQTIDDMELRYKDISWWKLSVNPLTKGSVMIVCFGEALT